MFDAAPRVTVLLCVCVAFLCSQASATAIYVSAINGTDSSSCGNATSPCQTIERAMSQVRANGSVLLLAGDYSEAVYPTQSNITIAAIDKSSVSLVCLGVSPFFTITQPITLTSLRFSQCAVAVSIVEGNSGSVTIDDCLFCNSQPTTESGVLAAGVQDFSSMSLWISHSSFVNLTKTISSSGSTSAAAALYVSGAGSHTATLSISNCTFLKNNVTLHSVDHSQIGGTVFVNNVATVSVLSSTFNSNSLNVWQSAPTSISLSGAALGVVQSSSLVIKDSSFVLNSLNGGQHRDSLYPSTDVHGGALYVSSCNDVGLQDVRFVTNQCKGGTSYNYGGGAAEGGAVYATRVSSLSIVDCLFAHNTAESGAGGSSYPPGDAMGGAVSITSPSGAASYTISNSSFTSSHANVASSLLGLNAGAVGVGGALYVDLSLSSLLIVDSNFSKNAVIAQMGIDRFAPGTMKGGAIFAIGGELNITRCELNSNALYIDGKETDYTGYMGGGAVAAEQGSLSISHTHLTSNRVSCSPDNYLAHIVKQCVGGAVYTNSFCAISDSLFLKNELVSGMGKLCGGAVYASENPLSITRTVFKQNSVRLVSCIYWTAEDQTLGGAVCQRSDIVEATDCVFEGNEVLSTCARVLMTQAAGGAIASCALNATNSYFSNNVAQSGYAYGAAFASFSRLKSDSILVCSSSESYIVKSNFTNNRAVPRDSMMADAAKGGAIYMENELNNVSLSVTVESCLLQNNSANLGGAVFVQGIPLVLEQSQLLLNSAVAGGAIYVNDVNLSTEMCLFERNNASVAAGAIFFQQQPYIRAATYQDMASSSFLHNTASLGGGALFDLILIDVPPLPCECDQPNSAIYGECCAASIRYLQPSCSYDANGVLFLDSYPIKFGGYLWPGSEFTLCLQVRDYYNNTVIAPSQLLANVEREPYFHSGVPQDLLPVDEQGHFVSSSAYFTSPSDDAHSSSVRFLMSQLPSSGYTFPSLLGVEPLASQLAADIEYRILPCPLGFYFSESRCERCHNPSWYTLSPQATSEADCVACPSSLSSSSSACFQVYRNDDSSSLESNQMALIPEGFWPDTAADLYPSLFSPSFISACHSEHACLSFSCSWRVSHDEFHLDCSYDRDGVQCSASDHFRGCCAAGYYERQCSRCVCDDQDDCYYLGGEGECVLCTTSNSLVTAGLLCICVLSLMILSIFPSSGLVLFVLENIIVFALVLLHVLEWWWLVVSVLLLLIACFVNRDIPTGIIKSFIFYVQMISSLMPSTAWPESIHSAVESSPFLSAAGLQCWFPWLSEPVPFLLFQLSIPWLLILTYVAVVMAAHYTQKFNFSKHFERILYFIVCLEYDEPDNNNEQTRNRRESSVMSELIVEESDTPEQDSPMDSQHASLLSRVLSGSLFLLTVFYYEESNIILKNFQPCTDGYMASLPWIPCIWSGSSYASLMIVTIAFLIIYVALFPPFLALLLFRFHKRILSHDHQLEQTIGFLYEDYRRDCFWYELVWVTRRLVLSLALTLFQSTEGRALQIPLISSILLVSLLSHLQVQPFQHRMDNIMEGIGSLVLLVSFVSAPSSSSESWQTQLVQWTLLVIGVSTAALYIVLLMLPLAIKVIHKYRSNRRRDYESLSDDSPTLHMSERNA